MTNNDKNNLNNNNNANNNNCYSIISRNQIYAPKILNLHELFKIQQMNDYYLTTTLDIDNFLSGGIYTSEILEIIGTSSMGKTQLCLYLTTLLSSTNQGHIYYLDSTKSFDINRIEMYYNGILKLSKNNKINKNRHILPLSATLSNINIHNIYNIYDLFKILDDIRNIYINNYNNIYNQYNNQIKLIVIDSIHALFTHILNTKSYKAQALMSILIRNMKSLAKEYNISFIMTNYAKQDNKVALGTNWLQ